MKKLSLKKLRICSLKEETGLSLNLNYPKIVIEGVNDTGKSCLVKSIYYTLGADLEFEDVWMNADTKCLATVEFDHKEFSILRDRQFFSIFDSNFIHIKTFAGITKGLSKYLTELLDFQLELIPQYGEDSTPTPLFMYLPFYIDQDSGWNPKKMYSSFNGIGQFKSPIKDTLDYYVGIRPKEYYLEKKIKDKKREEKASLTAKLAIVVRMLEKQRSELTDKYVNLNVDEYIEEIERILPDINKLKLAEEEYRDKVQVLANRRTQIEHQLHSCEAIKKSLEKDYEKSIESDETIVCPTCCAEYENDYSVRLELANDANKLSYLLDLLKNEKLGLEANILSEKNKMRSYSDKKNKLQMVLASKKDEIRVADVIKSEGKKTLLRELDTEREVLIIQINNLDDELKKLSKNMQSYTNEETIKKILEQYSLDLSNALVTLDVPNVNFEKIVNIFPKIKKFGSDGPRAVLAMFFSTLRQIEKQTTSIMFPIVIDEPNQQGQDKFNLNNVLEYIIDQAPKQAQLILAVEDLHDVQFPGEKIVLKNKNALLSKDQFQENKVLFEELISKRVLEADNEE